MIIYLFSPTFLSVWNENSHNWIHILFTFIRTKLWIILIFCSFYSEMFYSHDQSFRKKHTLWRLLTDNKDWCGKQSKERGQYVVNPLFHVSSLTFKWKIYPLSCEIIQKFVYCSSMQMDKFHTFSLQNKIEF